MLALLLVVSIAPVIWVVQTALRRVAGLPMRWRLSAQDAPGWVRIASRGVTQGALAAVIVLYPILSGESVRGYYAAMMPLDGAVRPLVLGFAAAVLYLSVLYLAWTVKDRVRFEMRRKVSRVVKHLLALPFSAVLGATVEELLFRGVLLAGLLAALPMWPAVLLGMVMFAGAHYVREVKRWWTLPGHLMLGLSLCLAYAWTRTLWLPIGLHAGGIFAIMAVRPFARYQGPAWLTGASIFPYAGVMGVVALAMLTWSLRGVCEMAK